MGSNCAFVEPKDDEIENPQMTLGFTHTKGKKTSNLVLFHAFPQWNVTEILDNISSQTGKCFHVSLHIKQL